MKRMRVVVLGLMLSLLIPSGAFAKPFTAMYVIGDSLSDQGNLFQATLTLIGSGRPAADHYYQGRFSDGEVYAGLLAEKIGLTLSATAFGGTNYAYGGTRTTYNIVENPPSPGGFPPGLYPWTLNLQRQAFAAQDVSDPHALYVVFSGANDIADLIGKTIMGGLESTRPASDQVVLGVKSVIEAYVAAGARDIIVPNLPDLGIVPRVLARNPPGSTLVSDTATALTVRYNMALDEMLKGVIGVNIIRFDTFTFFRSVVKNPEEYGLTNVTAPCYTGFVDPAGPGDTVCAQPETYLFWDNEHPTTAMHALLARQMLAALTSDLMDDLHSEVRGMGLHRGIATALQTMVAKARSMITDGNRFNDGAAVGLLHAFGALVGAQRGILISTDDADALMERAQQISELLEAMGRS
ncbi:hypothetical protein EG829_12445 [bacterium]|nr:hypothetical protein [bacterium]